MLIFDAGTGLRSLGTHLIASDTRDVDLFLSHTHYDHLMGFPFFRYAFEPSNAMRIWSGHLLPDSDTETALRTFMSPPFFPVSPDIFKARISFHDFRLGETIGLADGIRISTVALNHPDGATGYRVDFDGRSVCYLTDTEHVVGQPDRNVLGVIAGADILIYDSMFTDDEFPRYVGFGHSTWQEGVRLCKSAGVETLVLFHHMPDRDDKALDAIGAAAKKAFPGAIVAREGLSLSP